MFNVETYLQLWVISSYIINNNNNNNGSSSSRHVHVAPGGTDRRVGSSPPGDFLSPGVS